MINGRVVRCTTQMIDHCPESSGKSNKTILLRKYVYTSTEESVLAFQFVEILSMHARKEIFTSSKPSIIIRITFFSHCGEFVNFKSANSRFFYSRIFCIFNFLFIYTSILNILYKKREVFRICTRFI